MAYEILANNLEDFIVKEKITAKLSFKNDDYEVWEVDDDSFEKMTIIDELRFEEAAGDNAWWRYSPGSNLGHPYYAFVINGNGMFGWSTGYKDYDPEKAFYDSFTDYCLYHLGASQPKNLCAIAADMAKYNNMTISELFKLCQP